MNSCSGYFITGTDTGVGKTAVTLGLMQALQDRGNTVVGMKPVAAGCEQIGSGRTAVGPEAVAMTPFEHVTKRRVVRRLGHPGNKRSSQVEHA